MKVNRSIMVLGALLGSVTWVQSLFVITQPAPTMTSSNMTTMGTTTISINPASLGVGLAALGILGCLKLGLLALTAKVAAYAGYTYAKSGYHEPEYSSYNHYGGHHYVPSYSSGSSYGDSYGSSTLHRKKRSVEDQQTTEEMTLGEEEAFSLVHQSDATHCGERLVCELAKKEQYGFLESKIIDLLKLTPTDKSSDGSRSLYLSAMRRGQLQLPCDQFYSACPFTSSQIMATIRAFSSQLVSQPQQFLEIDSTKQKEQDYSTVKSTSIDHKQDEILTLANNPTITILKQTKIPFFKTNTITIDRKQNKIQSHKAKTNSIARKQYDIPSYRVSTSLTRDQNGIPSSRSKTTSIASELAAMREKRNENFSFGRNAIRRGPFNMATKRMRVNSANKHYFRNPNKVSRYQYINRSNRNGWKPIIDRSRIFKYIK